MPPPHPSPRLLADIGGTYARFALETAPGVLEHVHRLRCDEHPDFHHTVRAYLATVPADNIEHAAVAIAYPVEGDWVRMTNYHWQFSIEEERQRLSLETLLVVNDFTALALAVPRLQPHERVAIGGGHPTERSVVGVIGAGTGLGVSGLIPAQGGWVALGTEGGHANFGPRDERELAILRHAWKQYRHVSTERLLSGQGLELIYTALAEQAGQKPHAGGSGMRAPEITQRALARTDPVCEQAVDAFCAILGTAAANLALTLGARGGIYIGGGIVPRLGNYFERSPFRQRFEDKGRMSDYVRQIPTYVIQSPEATFLGASAILDTHLQQALGGESAQSVLSQIRRGLEGLSRAERKVAEHVLAHPRQILNDPIADIARAADVSQPTVIRFCRSLGCEGLSDFKLRLASSLTGTVPVTHTQVTAEDSMVELGGKVMGNTAAAILQVRNHLNRDSIDRAIDLINSAQRLSVHASGYMGVVAQDAQFKFLRLGLSCNAYTDPRLHQLATGVLQQQDVVLVISSSGRTAELLEVVDAAQARGAPVIAVTVGQSPLARRADVALLADHSEDLETHVPMISRILMLLFVDILAVGVALRRGQGSEDELVSRIKALEAAPADRALGVRAARQPLAL
ncbi:MAG: glucokinase [Betaproteobacteria bacterium]|nr:glucokinase [Betaproteobacteria bacterium]